MVMVCIQQLASVYICNSRQYQFVIIYSPPGFLQSIHQSRLSNSDGRVCQAEFGEDRACQDDLLLQGVQVFWYRVFHNLLHPLHGHLEL